MVFSTNISSKQLFHNNIVDLYVTAVCMYRLYGCLCPLKESSPLNDCCPRIVDLSAMDAVRYPFQFAYLWQCMYSSWRDKLRLKKMDSFLRNDGKQRAISA